jgi:hypothetical protein
VIAYKESWRDSKSETKFADLISNLMAKFQLQYGSFYDRLMGGDGALTHIGRKLFHYLVTGNEIDGNDKELEDLMFEGIITTDSNNKLLMPFAYYYKLVNESRKFSKPYFSLPMRMSSDDFEQVFLEILTYKLTKGFTIGNTVTIQELFRGGYINSKISGMEVCTSKDFHYYEEQKWWYEDGRISDQETIYVVHPSDPDLTVNIPKDQRDKYMLKAPKDHTTFDGRGFAGISGHDKYKHVQLLLQMKQKIEIREEIQLTNPTPSEWRKTAQAVIDRSKIASDVLTIKVFLTCALLPVKECKELISSDSSFIILDKKGLSEFLSPQIGYAFRNNQITK